ncbi:MAG: tetratricopeptide repeat protein [Calditrichaeota bacterium]|nr:tetratricopeptide repeat protein [Calditrichota bacterium]
MRFILLFTLIAIGFAQDHNEIVDLLKKGNTEFGNQQYDKAREFYQEGIVKDPNNPNLWFNMGNVYFQQKQYADARSAYFKALDFKDTLNLSRTNYNVGNTFMFESKLDTAITYYKRALELNPNDDDAKYNLELARSILKEKSKKEQQEQQQQQDQKKQEPSEYAKKLYQQALELVKEYKFNEALDLMNRGLKTDPTVAAFNEFIKKLDNIVKLGV